MKLPTIDIFFQINDLVTAKQMLNTIMQYAVNGKDLIKAKPSVIVQFRELLYLFIRECYCISTKTRKWRMKAPPELDSPLMKGLLSDEEYKNPLLVFKKAFTDYSVKEFDYFISGIVYFSQKIYRYGPESNLVRPYIHLVKMLDAAYLIKKSITKNKKK